MALTQVPVSMVDFSVNPTLSGGTANGVAYLNGSKVVTTGSALVFDGTNLLNDQSTASPIGLRLKNGSTSTSAGTRVSFEFGGSTTGYVGNQFDGSDFNNQYQANRHHIWLNGATEQMRLTSTGLGIGTSSPAVPLTVGDSTAPTNVTLNTVLISTNTASGSVVAIRRSADNNTGAVFNFLKSRGTAASPTAVTSGDVVLNLIGSAYGGTNYRNLVSIQGNVETYTSDTDISSYLSFLTTPSGSVSRLERMRLDSSGNLGIGTSSPNTRLHVYGDGSVYGQVQSSGAGNAGLLLKNTQRAWYVLNNTSGLLQFYDDTAAATRLTLDASGNFLVGTTNTSSYAGDSLAYETSNGYLVLNHSSAKASGWEYIYFQHNANVIGSIDQNGTTGVSYNTTSDYRLKEDVQPMTGALAKVAALKPCTYKWKVDGSAGEGFIAHELAEVVPQAVTGSKDAVNEDGSIKPQGIDTSFLVATLTAAIQELKAEFDAYKATHP